MCEGGVMGAYRIIFQWMNEPDQKIRLELLSEILRRASDSVISKNDDSKKLLLLLGLLDPRIQSRVAREFESKTHGEIIDPDFTLIFQALLTLQSSEVSLQDPSLERFNFKELLKSVPNGAAWAIDPLLRTFYIKGRLTPISNAMLDLLLLLKEKKVVTFAEAVRLCFSLYPFDGHAHAAKVHNLLYRLRKLIPTIGIVTKEYSIYLQGSMSDIKFLKMASFAYELSLNKQWRALAESAWPVTMSQIIQPAAREHQVLFALMVNGPQTRSELQSLTGMPKPSLLRYLYQLQKDQVVMVGHGEDVPVYTLFPQSLINN
jgi:hypothetical protein